MQPDDCSELAKLALWYIYFYVGIEKKENMLKIIIIEFKLTHSFWTLFQVVFMPLTLSALRRALWRSKVSHWTWKSSFICRVKSGADDK